ncbi:uncharacterized protein LOC128985522 [Macrosteles quadrilineatus]|uniref:uncharacterized protein LOC128985522 n=1 Tax=Macrosteles quadrilineatus TaxID=74068 RepID=UPI0023E0CF47|nr:uncharacterized protein LOC128985522 [Macrosteles quadrilineatus]
MMALTVRLLVPLCLLIVGCLGQKVQETRTKLHVARSLDPASMEEMQVKSRTGEIATILVKKRDGRQHFPFVKENINHTENKTSSLNTTVVKNENVPQNVPKPVVVSSEPINTKDEKEISPVSNEPKESVRDSKNQAVPQPVFVRSTQVFVKGQQKDSSDWENRARSLMTVDSDGIPVIEGVRMPDDESDKVVWRNARVIDGKLTPYDKNQPKHTFDVKYNTEKKKFNPQSTSTVQWVRVEPVKQTVPKESYNSYKGPWSQAPVLPPPVQEKFKPSELIAVVTTPSAQEWYEFHHPQQQNVKIVDEPTSYLPENEMYVRDRILDYIKKINREEVNKKQNIFNAERESRTVKEAAHPQIQARVLQNPGSPVYPTSLLYSPPSQQPSRVSFEEGVRTPVLQYAHPELGVQPAKVAPTPDSELADAKLSDRREQALAYFAHDIHADRSPYAFEPGLEDEARVEDFSNNGKRSHSGVPQRPKKTLPYFYADQAVTDNYRDKYYSKYSYSSNSHPTYSAYQSSVDNRPFWQRMSDSIKEHVQTSMDKVSDLTRPVMEPLVEATHKISKNLGLESTGYRELNTIKEKLGMAGTPSVIFPALGLVAGGAALGLGAVAVGRYLDVDMLKRSKGSDGAIDDDLSAEHKRAMESIARTLAESPSVVEGRIVVPAEAKEAEEVIRVVEAAEEQRKVEEKTRRRRSVDPDEAMEAVLQSLDSQRTYEGSMPSHAVWSTTPCAKKVFCEVMTVQSDDAVILTEKKMDTYLKMIDPAMAATVGYHLDDVMRAVRHKDCSTFVCPSVTPRELAEYPGPR